MFRILALTASALALTMAAAPQADGAFVGEERLLVVLVTWGPEPFSASQAEAAVFSEADAYLRSASFGRAWITGVSLGWVHALAQVPTGCDLETVGAAARAAAAARGYDIGTFDRLVIGMPEFDCPWGGAYFGGDVWVHGRIDRNLIVHELGHLYGVIEEGPAWHCDGGSCDVFQYGNPYSVMGHGWTDYNAFEKLVFGWIEETPPTPGELDLAAIDRPSASPHALFVTTAGDMYAIEFRSPEPRLGYGETDAAPGVVVHAGPNGLSVGPPSRFPTRDLYLANPAGTGRPSVQAGESYVVPGIFTVTVLSAGADSARIRFAWTDRTRPTRPRILAAGRRLSWRPSAERGSGVARYELRVDRRPVRTVRIVNFAPEVVSRNLLRVSFGRLARGRHRVAVTAVDRAGNRSPTAVRTFRVR